MSDDIPLLRLQDAWRECERHVYHLFHALSSIRAFCPLTGESYANLTDEVSVHSPLPFPGNAAILAAISAGETPALPGGSERLPDEQVQDVDQFILRFTKLQDTMGSRLFPAILHYLTEPFDERPMLDKLNRLEKLGFINSVEKWQTVRNIRNKFAHDYPNDLDKNAAQLNLAFESVMDLYAMLTTIKTRLKAEYPLLELGKSLPQRPPAWVLA